MPPVDLGRSTRHLVRLRLLGDVRQVLDTLPVSPVVALVERDNPCLVDMALGLGSPHERAAGLESRNGPLAARPTDGAQNAGDVAERYRRAEWMVEVVMVGSSQSKVVQPTPLFARTIDTLDGTAHKRP